MSFVSNMSASSMLQLPETTKRVEHNAFIDTFISEIDRHFHRAAVWTMAVWIAMAVVSFAIASKYDCLEQLDGTEQSAPFYASMLLLMSLLSECLPLMYQRNRESFNGVIKCSIVIRFIAFATDLSFAIAPTPVFVDPVGGNRVYLIRWCEWVPLATLMTFLTEGSDAPLKGPLHEYDEAHNTARMSVLEHLVSARRPNDVEPDETANLLTHQNGSTSSSREPVIGTLHAREVLKQAYKAGACQGFSTLCGWLFPFCPGPISWSIVMTISFLFFSHIFYRVHDRRKVLAEMEGIKTVEGLEMQKWSQISLRLLETCLCMWLVLVIAFMMYTIGPLVYPQIEFLSKAGFSMTCDSSFDVISKALFLIVISDAHYNTFDPTMRQARKLEELKQMLGVLWYNSSDVIGISVKNSPTSSTTMLSPTFLRNFSTFYSNANVSAAAALTFSLALHDDGDCSVGSGSLSNTSNNGGVTDVRQIYRNLTDNVFSEAVKQCKGELSSMGELVERAWNECEGGEILLMHDLIHKERKIRCETKVTRIEENSLIIVVRDISERFRRFEAEKKVISETTARQKDAEANRFTRHEVKNGLLAAIGLCDSLRESLSPDNLRSKLDSRISLYRNSDLPTSSQTELDRLAHSIAQSSDVDYCLIELDKMLHEILDTILAEAMARDVIHEIYEPNLERVDLSKLFDVALGSDRFPAKLYPETMPNFALDPQLMKYIHRNAVSNGCKYGKKGGVVRTEVRWDQERSMLEMDVINSPGDHHSEILKLGEFAREIVFSPRKRLSIHNATGQGGETPNHSSGDGAWIMEKCAKTLGGHCDIQFESDKTIFRFRCPVEPFNINLASSVDISRFELPTNIYGIAVDDSKVQRKLLHRFFLYAGVPKERIKILGSTSGELLGFSDWLVEFIDNHPDDYFLVLVDENLEVQEDEEVSKHITISGSLCVSDIRRRLLHDQERRTLALMRSANDSANDVAIYNSRAHGYLPKAPLKKDRVIESLAGIWLARFPSTAHGTKSSAKSSTSNDSNECDIIVTADDLMGMINKINQFLSSEKNGAMEEKWAILWEMLHTLKGDLLTIPETETVTTAIDMIKSLRGPRLPNQVMEKWKVISNLVVQSV